MKKAILYILYWIWSLTWGCIMTSIGLIVAMLLLLTGHRPYRLGPNIYFKIGAGWGGVNFGAFFIVSRTATHYTKLHEAGHGLQNLILGPLMPFIISIPSAIRYWHREYIRRTNRQKYFNLPDYDSIWFEKQATEWGKKIYDIK